MIRTSPPTQQQIARHLGISQALVSRALSGRAGEIGAAPATVEKIRRAAAAWNYQPNSSALALLGAPTRTIGVVVKNFEDPYFGRLIGELQRLACECQHSLLLTGGSDEDQAALQKHRVDGVILAGSDFLPELLKSPAGQRPPVVQIGTGPQLPESVQIFLDEEHGISELVGHLAGLGHRDIGFVGKAIPANQRRGEILRRTLKARGLPVRKDWFLTGEAQEAETAEAAVNRLRGLKHLPSALMAAEDDIALALISALARAGWSVPRDFSVVGIDDIPASAWMLPSLTALRQPVAGMARAAMTALIGGAKPARQIIMRGQLILRESCAPPGHRSPTRPDKISPRGRKTTTP